MKHTSPAAILNCRLLRFVREEHPTVEEFLEQYGGPHEQWFHVLRKHRLILIEDDCVRLNPAHLSASGREFWWGNRVFSLEEDRISYVCFGPEHSR